MNQLERSEHDVGDPGPSLGGWEQAVLGTLPGRPVRRQAPPLQPPPRPEHWPASRPRLAEPVHPLDRVIEVLLAGLIVFGPATWGVVEAWSFEIVQAIVATMVGLLLVRLFLQRRVRPVVSWAYLPAALMLGGVALQVLPLPRGVVEWISPSAARLWVDALGGQATRMPLSLYPLQTQRLFAVLLVGASVFVVAANVLRTRAQVVRLLGLMVVLGAAVAGLGISQSFMGGEAVYWFVPPTHGNSGPFMNHNHYAQFLIQAIGAGLALFLLAPSRAAGQWAARAALAAFLLFTGVGVVLSESRGGVGALAAAAVVGVVVLPRRWRDVARGLSVLVGAGVLVAGAAFYYGGGGALARLRNFSFASESASERLTIWSGALRTFEKFPWTGTGLGSFEFVYRMSLDWVRHRITHADNDYLQMLAECGVLGTALVAMFLLLLGSEAWRIVRAKETSELVWIGRVLALVVLAAALQGATDFAQRLPGIAVVTATYCGILVAAAASVRSARSGAATTRPRRRHFMAVGLLALLGVFAWTLVTVDRDRRAEHYWSRAEVVKQQGPTTDAQFAALIGAADEAVSIQPRDARRQFWLAVYRWRSISRDTDEHGYVIMTDRTRDITRRIVYDFLQIPRLCPSYANPWLMAGQLELLVLDDPRGRDHALMAQQRNLSLDRLDERLGPNAE